MKRNVLTQYLIITASCALYAVGFNWMFDPNHISVGGFTGLGQIINYLLPGLPIGTIVIILNVPLFVLGWRFIGKDFLFSSVYATAVSSLMIDGLAAVHTFKPMEPILACLYGGVIIGVSCGSVVALIYILFLFFRTQRGRQVRGTDRPEASGRILSNLLKLAVPITLGSAATSLVTLIDTKLVMSQLTDIFHRVDGLVLNADGTGAALDAARGLYGIYSKTMSIYNLPFSMMVPLTACIIPAVSAALARRDRREAQKVSESALRVGLLLALPMGMGLFALGGPIMGLLFPAIDVSIAGPLLSVLGLASIFVALQLLCNSILQANGMVNLPILAVIIGGVVKILVNYTLVGNPDIRINGAPVGTLCCFIVISALEIFMIRRAIPSPPSFLRAFVKPFIPSAVMALAAWGSYGLLTKFLHLGNSLATLGAIFVGVVVYLVLVLVLRVISKDDLALMPKGDKIAKILHIQ